MTWFSPATLAVDDVHGGVSLGDWAARPGSSGLGSAIAGSWAWDSARAANRRERPAAVTFPQAEGVHLRAPREILTRMAGAAGALGRSESDVWVEAAREWLLRHAPESPAGGHPAISGAPAPSPVGAIRSASPVSPILRRARVWRDIDGVLTTLRAQSPSRRDAPGAA